jgi:branched-chain amino acid transport system ATP-binding protein
MTGGPLLSVEGLTVITGGLAVLNDVTIRIKTGQVLALLGANGAGKSTLLRAIMGLERASRGQIYLGTTSIVDLRADQRARLGVGYCPEGRRLFPRLTVRENLEVASWEKASARSRRVDELFAMLPALRARSMVSAWKLSGGQQQMLAIGRSLMTRPRLLLLDEPTLGLSPKVADEVMVLIPTIAAAGVSVVLAEQSAARALSVCDAALVLRKGRIALTVENVRLNDVEAIRQAALGG